MLKNIDEPKIDGEGSALVIRGTKPKGNKREGKQRP